MREEHLQDDALWPPPAAICFDFDGTLAHYRGDFSSLNASLADALGLSRDAREAFLADLPRRFLSEPVRDTGEAVARSLDGLGLPPPSTLVAICAHYRARYAAGVEAARGALELLTALRDAGLPLALVSNGPGDMQRAALAHSGLDPLFSAVLVSGDAEVGARKPDARIFALACERLGLPAGRVLMVGDRRDADIAGALAFGMQAVLVGGSGGWSAAGRRYPGVTDLQALGRYLRERLEALP